MNAVRRCCRAAVSLFLLLLLPAGVHAAPVLADERTVRFESPCTGSVVTGRVTLPPARERKNDAPVPAVIYLKNLSLPRLGKDTDEQIVGDLVSRGHLVAEFDYARHANAIGPGLQADVLALRREIGDHKLLAAFPIDLNHLFIVPEGFQIRRDVEFARDGRRVLAMDILYPSRCTRRVATLMEITCDNANRMGNGSLVFCHDTLLEGGMFAGFAAAMIDHPVRPPYKGMDDPMPELIHRLKAAVRKLRATGSELALSDRIGAIGFSRGSNMAALLAMTGDRADLEGAAAHADASSRVQAAMAHGGRFDYLHLRDDDPMLERFAKAWGPRDANADRWAAHGALNYFNGKSCAPMFLNTSNTEAPEFRDQLAVMAGRLTDANVPCVYSVDADGRGHRVSTDPKTLAAVYAFFAKHLDGPQTPTEASR